MDQSRLGPAVFERHPQRVEDELGAHVVGHRPAHDPAREDVLDRRQVEPALPGSEVGDVRDPKTVGAVGSERAVDEVLADADPGNTDRGASAPAPDQAADARGSHQTLHALAPEPLAIGEHQLGVDARRPIDAPEPLMDLGDPDGQALILDRPRRRLARLPGMKSRPADIEHAAHDRDRVLGLLRGDEPEDPHRVSLSLAKKAAAFFRMSRSSARIRFSRRSRRSSSRSSVVKPSALPSSTSTWRDQFRNDCSEHPSSRANCGIGRPLDLSNRTASARNSFEYGGVFGIDRHPLQRARWPSRQMSTKPGELQTMGREWAYGRSYPTSDHRASLLKDWLEHYNHRRPHSAIGNRAPITRVHNL